MHSSAIIAVVVFVVIKFRTVVAFSTSANTDTIIIRSYSLFGGNDDDRNTNIIHEIRPKPRDLNVDEDEIEMYYSTTRRAFMFPNNDTNEESDNNNLIINIRQTSFGCGRLGANVWPSAIALSACLLADDTIKLKNKKIIELGAGCGLPSAYLANDKGVTHQHSILATDYWEEDVVATVDGKQSSTDDPLYRNSALGQTAKNGDRLIAKKLFGTNLAYNIGSDENDHASVKRLDWHDEMGIFKLASDYCPDVIIGSDLVYYPMDTVPLLQTIEILCKAGGAKYVLLIFPLGSDNREALPDFRERLENGELGDNFEVIMDELEMVGRGSKDVDGDEDSHNFLRIRIHHNVVR